MAQSNIAFELFKVFLIKDHVDLTVDPKTPILATLYSSLKEARCFLILLIISFVPISGNYSIFFLAQIYESGSTKALEILLQNKATRQWLKTRLLRTRIIDQAHLTTHERQREVFHKLIAVAHNSQKIRTFLDECIPQLKATDMESFCQRGQLASVLSLLSLLSLEALFALASRDDLVFNGNDLKHSLDEVFEQLVTLAEDGDLATQNFLNDRLSTLFLTHQDQGFLG